MPILDIEGFGSVEVGEDFPRLPRAAQEDFVRKVIAQRQGSPGTPQASNNSGLVDAAASSVVDLGANVADAVGGIAQRIGADETGSWLEGIARQWRDSAKRTYQRPADMPETTFQLLRQGRVREALETLPRDAAESLGSLILGTAASTAGPVGIAAFGGTLGLDQMGQMRNERRELGLDPQVTAIDAGSAAAGAALQAGRMRGGVLPRMGREGLQETGQQGTQIGGNALQGVDKSQGEIVDELGQAFVLGGAMRGGQDAVSTVARAPAAATGALVRGAADLTRRDTVRNYDDEQVASDLRVVEAYNRRRAAEQSSTTNSEVDASVTFKGIMDDYTRALKELGGALEAGGQINREQRRLLDAAISEGARHNREVADPAGPDYFETLRQRLSGIGLDPQVEETAIRAIRDLNTATYNSKYKNRRGPFESAASKIPGPLGIGPLAAITAAATANPAPLAALAARGLARRAGAALDRVAGTSGPEVLARARVVAREAARRGLPQDNIATDLQDTTFDIKARTATQQQQSQAQAAAYNQQANALGLVRGGGWAPAITSTVSNIAPGTVDIEDPIRAVEDLARMGAIARDRADALINDRTTRPTEAEMRLITDYVTTAATQVQRESWNRPSGPPGPPSGPVSPSPPVARVENQVAYDEKMRSVALLNDAIRTQAQGADPATQALAENVINAKSRDAKEAAFGQGTGNPQVDALLRSAIDATSSRSGVPGRSTSVVGPEGQRARVSAARPGVSVPGVGRDPTARVSQRAGVPQGVDTDGRRAKTEGKAGRGPKAKAGTQGSLKQAQADAEPMEGLPRKIKGLPFENGPHVPARESAREYMEEQGLPYAPPKRYVRITGDKADPGRLQVSQRVAQAFDEAKDDISDPLVAASYAKMAEETLAQWEFMKATGITVEFNPEPNTDPYGGSPWGAVKDVRENNHLYVFPTKEGFGSDETQGALTGKNRDPMEEVVPGEDWGRGIPVLVNDIFRAVHDYYGHIKEGNGFRADGEENAWRSHASMYSPLARLAMTTETRGQNSWLNFGPYAEKNQTAKTEDTVFAAQKKAILPAWVHYDGAEDFLEPLDIEALRQEVVQKDKPKSSPAVLRKDVPKEVNAIKLLSNDGELARDVSREHVTWQGKGPTLKTLAEYFDANNSRIIKPSEAEIAKLINETTDEAVHQIGNSNSGKGWYALATTTAIDIASQEIPQLKDNVDLQRFSFLLATPMSGGADPKQEGINSFHALQIFLETGKVPIKRPGGKDWGRNATPQIMDMVGRLVDRMGLDGFVDFCFTKHTGKEIADLKKSTGLFQGNGLPAGMNMKHEYPGAFIFGQKFGPYALNKAGFEEYATKDMWFYRNMFRKMGSLSDGPGQVSDSGIRESPGPGEASLGDRFTAAVAENLGSSVADAQAILWFFEKRLYDAMGIRGVSMLTPVDGAKAYVERKRAGTLD